jgi:hypothetical protein
MSIISKIKLYFANKILSLHKEINLIKCRWKAESPEFFKKLKKSSIKIGGSAAAVMGVNSIMSLNLDSNLTTALSYLIAICAAIAGTSQLTVNDPNSLPNN